MQGCIDLATKMSGSTAAVVKSELHSWAEAAVSKPPGSNEGDDAAETVDSTSRDDGSNPEYDDDRKDP